MKPSRPRRLNYILYLLVVTIIIILGFGIYFTFQIHKQLASIVDNPGRWPAGAYIYDEQIGFDFASNISASVNDGRVYVKSHQLGFRIGKDESSSEYGQGGVLSLGCSFTYGDHVRSEESFTQIFADSLGVDAYNYGISSFSYIHALLKADKLRANGTLDKLQPQYVVLGCWNGLLDRSRSPYPPLMSENIPLVAAHIVKDENGLKLNPPENIEYAFELVDMYRKKGSGMSLKKFFRIFGLLPEFLSISLAGRQDIIDESSDNFVSDLEIYKYYLNHIKEIFAPYGSRIIVLYMPYTAFDIPDKALTEALTDHPDVILVNGLDALREHNIPESDYVKKHPRTSAHRTFAWKMLEEVNLSLP